MRGGVGLLLGREVAAGERLATHVRGVLVPHIEDVVGAADEPLCPPEHEHGALHASTGCCVDLVVLKVNRRGGAVILAAGPDHLGITEAPDVLLDRLGREGIDPGRARPLCEFAPQPVARVGPYQVFG